MMTRHGAAVLVKSPTYRIPSPRNTTFCVENHQNPNKYASGSHLFSERGALLPSFARGFHPVTTNSDHQLRVSRGHLRLVTAYRTLTPNPLIFLRRQSIMPGLPRRQSFELMRDMGSTHGPGIMRLAPLPKPLPRLDSADGIKYIPAQQDPMAASTTSAARQSPIRLFFEDAGVLLRLLPYLPNIFLPLKTNNSTNELYLHLAGTRNMILQTWLFVMETVLLLLAVPVFLVLPGLISLAGLALSWWTIWLTAKPMEGPRIAYSKMNDDTLAIAEQRKDERWLFVNGCAVA